MAFGKKRSKTVSIDGKRLSELLEKKGYSPGDACKELGGYTGMMSNAVYRGRLAVGFVDLIREKFGIQPEEYVTGEMPAEEEKAKTAPPPETMLNPEPEPEGPCDGLKDPIHDAVAKLLAIGVEAGTRKNSELIAETILTNTRMVERTLLGRAIDYDQLSVSLFWAIDAAIWSITRKYTTGNPVVKEIINQKNEKE